MASQIINRVDDAVIQITLTTLSAVLYLVVKPTRARH
jgi:hypothetical protein